MTTATNAESGGARRALQARKLDSGATGIASPTRSSTSLARHRRQIRCSASQ